VCILNHNREGQVMDNVTTVGIDLAKSTFSLHGVDANGAVLLRKTVSRSEPTGLVTNLPPCLIGMEACLGAHEWARQFAAYGHTVKLIAPKFVTPYRKSGKNDGNDAEAICEAVSRPNMRVVPVKTLEQQAVLTLHRVRLGFIEERTATVNRLRGLLAEFGIVMAQAVAEVRRQVPRVREQLPAIVARGAKDLLEHLGTLVMRIREYEYEIEVHGRQDAATRLAQQRPGIGPMTASAIVASIGDAHDFKNGRQFSTRLGLVPKQYSTGGKTRLGHITRRGDAYLRTLLVMGARSVLQRAARQSDPLAKWALTIKERRGYHRACVAIASKNARVVWAMLAHRNSADVV
jgi:transposase